MSWHGVLSPSLSLTGVCGAFLTASSLFLRRPQGEEEERDRRTDGWMLNGRKRAFKGGVGGCWAGEVWVRGVGGEAAVSLEFQAGVYVK